MWQIPCHSPVVQVFTHAAGCLQPLVFGCDLLEEGTSLTITSANSVAVPHDPPSKNRSNIVPGSSGRGSVGSILGSEFKGEC
jgi:hypothetical protein